MSAAPNLSPERMALLEQMLREEGLADGARSPAIPKRTIFSPVPQSFAQQRLWFLDQLAPGTPVYNVETTLRLDIPVDAVVLKRALNEIVRRHESLRTTFRADDGVPVQVVAPALEIDLPVVEVGDEAEAMQLAASECSRPFDLVRGPLMAAVLFKLADDDFLLAARVHHIVCDGWSIDVFLGELSALYDAYSRGEPSPLPELAVQYADYALWQHEQVAGDRFAGQLAYWKKQLANAPALQLPYDFPRPRLQTSAGATQKITIAGATAKRIRELGNRYDATLFMTLLASFQVLLHRYTGQEDIVLGSPVAGRNRIELEALIGFFVNNLVLRSDVHGDPSFTEFLRRVRGVVLAAMANAEIPFDKLVEDAHPTRETTHTPLFNAVFALNPAGQEGFDGPDLTPLPGTAKFDLTVSCLDAGESVAVTAEYSTDLFRDGTIRRMLLNFRTLLDGIARRAQSRISELPLLTPDESESLLHTWQGAAVVLPERAAVHRMVEEAAKRFPTRIAVADGERAVTYSELNAKAETFAEVLRDRGVGAGHVVPVQMGRSVELLVAELAVLKTGAAFAPLDPTAPEQRVAGILNELGPPVFVSSVDVNPTALADARRCTSSETAYVIYTSGSTGKPKGVQISHRSLTSLIEWHRRAYDVGSEDRATLLASPAFDASVWEIWPYLARGASLYVVDDATRDDPSKLWKFFARNSITLAFLPTPLAELALQHPLPRDLRLRALLTGGDRLHRAPEQGLPFGVFNHYGPTENTVVSTCGRAEPDDATEPHIGQPIDNVRAYVLDRNHRLLPVGAIGELFLGGAGLTLGYVGEEHGANFIDDPFGSGERLYATGDLVRRRDDGNFEFVGRRDSQVKIRGVRIELGEIECVLAEHPKVRESAVVARSHGGSELRILAYVSLHEAQALTPGELHRFTVERLPRYMAPSAITVLDRLPLTTNGKVDRDALPEPLEGGRVTGQVALRSKTEQQIAAVWRDLLGVSDIGSQDNFFDLGGHSLLLISLQARLRELFDRPVAVVDLFRYPSVGAFAKFLTEENGVSGAAEQARKQLSKQASAQGSAAALRARARERIGEHNERR